MEASKALGDFLREARKKKGLNVLQASKVTGVSHQHIKDLELGNNCPTVPLLKKLLLGYGIDPKNHPEIWDAF